MLDDYRLCKKKVQITKTVIRDDLQLATIFIYPLLALTLVSVTLMWYYVGFYFYSLQQALDGAPQARAWADAWSTQDFLLSVLATFGCGVVLYPVALALDKRGRWVGTLGYVVSLVCIISSLTILLVATLILLIPCVASGGSRRQGHLPKR